MTRDIETLRMITRIVLVIAAIGSTSFPVVYAFSPWRTRAVGRVLMLLGVSLALAVDLTVLFIFWTPSSIMLRFWINILILSAIAISTFSVTWTMWRLNHPIRKKVHIKMQLSSGVYDVLKSVAQIWLPAAGTLYFTLAQLWGLPSAEEVSGTILAVDTFLGVILGISSNTYRSSGAAYDGTMAITDDGDGGSMLRMKSVDLEALATKQVITFRVMHPPKEPEINL
jgi:hypothetical protein